MCRNYMYASSISSRNKREGLPNVSGGEKGGMHYVSNGVKGVSALSIK